MSTLLSLLCKIFNLNSLSKNMDSLVRVGSKISFGVDLCIGVCIAVVIAVDLYSWFV